MQIDKQLQEEVNDRLYGMKQLFINMSQQIGNNYPEIRDKIDKAGQRLDRDLDRIPEMLQRAERQKQKETAEQWQALVNWFYPLGKPQERILSFASIGLILGEQWWPEFKNMVDALERKTAWVSLEN